MIRFIDAPMEQKYRQIARNIAQRLRETGFYSSGNISNLIRFEALTYSRRSEQHRFQISAELVEVLIREEFEGLYGMSPEAYDKTVDRKGPADGMSIQEDAIAIHLFMKFIEETLGRES